MTSLQLYLRLLGYVKPYWHAFAVSILGMAIAAATEPLFPALLKPFLDGTFVQKDDWVTRWAPMIILVIFFVRVRDWSRLSGESHGWSARGDRSHIPRFYGWDEYHHAYALSP